MRPAIVVDRRYCGATGTEARGETFTSTRHMAVIDRCRPAFHYHQTSRPYLAASAGIGISSNQSSGFVGSSNGWT